MLIKYHHVVRDKKGLLLLVIIDILKEYTSPNNRMKKTELCDKIEQYCGFPPARNTVYDKLNTLEDAGFPIVQDSHDGVYYDGYELSEGQIRFLVDSVLYSDFVTLGGADEMIEALAAFGSPELQKYIRSQKSRAEKTRKNMQKSVFASIEEMQSALSKNRQITCNYLTYRADLTTEKVYSEDIIINPYELVFKNGKYYLLGALKDSEKILSWRVDRLCDVKALETRCQEVPMLKEINASGGMSVYADKQPDLCGGVMETFKIQCMKDAIDEIVDVFGRDFSIAPEQKDNYDDETVILSVKATRESMKAWAFSHAGSMVVIAPEDFRKEILGSLSDAERMYHVTGKPLHVRIFTAKNLAEAVRFSQKRAGKSLIYHGNGSRREPEHVDLTELLKMPDLTSFSISNCILEHTECLKLLPMLCRLSIVHCTCNHPEDFTGLTGLQELRTDDEELAAAIGSAVPLESLALLRSQIRDASLIAELTSLHSISFVDCRELTDCSALENAVHIEKLELRDCPAVSDFSFLDKMKNLKEFHESNVPISKELLNRLQKKNGLKVRSRYLRDSHSEDMVIRPGIDPAVLD